MRLQQLLAAVLSSAIAAGPASAGQRANTPIIPGASRGTAVPLVSLPSLPAVKIAAPGRNAPLALPDVSIPALAASPAAVAPRALAAAPGSPSNTAPEAAQQPSARPGAPVRALEQAAQIAAEKPEQAPAALSALYGEGKAPVAGVSLVSAAPQAPASRAARLSRWVRGPAAKTTAALAAAASPLAILATKASQKVVPLYSNMDPEHVIGQRLVEASGQGAVFTAAAIGSLIGLTGGAILARALSKGLKDRPQARGAAVLQGALIGGILAGAGAAAMAVFSPAVAAVVMSAVVLAAAAQADMIAPYTRWRESRRREAGLFDVATDKGGAKYFDFKPEQLGKLYMLSGTLERGVGEKNLATNTQWDMEFAFYLRRAGEKLELVRRNTSFRAPEGSPMHRTLSRGVPDSVVASAAIKEIDGRLRVPVAELLAHDFFGLHDEVEYGYEGEYALDREASGVSEARAFPLNVEVRSRLSYARQAGERPETHLADTRRVDLSMRYSLSALPEDGYRPREATPLIGHFSTIYEDWSDDQRPDLERALVNRWRLEKSDPTQEASPVKKPIVFWIDNTIPQEYREAIKRGTLRWNKAFERIGLLNAIEVREAPDDESFDPTDIRRNMISYRFERDSPFALGNSRANPLTGEIYHAHVTIVPEHVRNALQLRFKDVAEWTERDTERSAREKKARPEARGHRHDASCRHGEAIAADASLALAVLESRAMLSPDWKRRVLESYMEELTAHEIGHTLGLRHNFVAKSWLSLEEASESEVFSASVMDYAPMNLASREEKQGPLFQTELGPYDYLAIEYAYKPLDPATEREELSKIAARTSERGLEYLTDEDQGSLDPRVYHSSLGNDLVKYAGRRVSLTRELWEKLEADAASGASDHQLNYRKWLQGWLGYNLGARQAARVVGGMYFHRTAGGQPAGRPSYEAIPAAEQRRALDFLAAHVLSDEPFAISPTLLGAIAQPRSGGVMEGGWAPDLTHFSHAEMITWMRNNVINLILDPVRLQRLAESAALLGPGEERLTVRDVYQALADASFSELSTGGRRRKKGSRAVSPMRRELQDKLVGDLIEFLDAEEWQVELRAPAREVLASLQRQLGSALKSGAWDAESRAHLTELQRRARRALTPSRD